MKKILLAFAFLGFATLGVAQETYVPVNKYSVATNGFWSNWFVSVGGQYNANYSSQEASNVPFAPFSSRRGEFGFNVAVGKWFTPGIGLRTKFEGVWSKQVNTKTDHHHYNYWNLHEDLMLNLSNMLCGYNENRVWNFIPYLGIGVARDMTYDNYDISYQVGILNNFRITKNISAFVDIYGNAIEGTFDGANRCGVADPWKDYKKTRARHWDKMLGAAVGLTFNLNKSNWEKVPDVDALMAMNKEQMDALNASLEEQQQENARLREMLANQPKPVEKKDVVKQSVPSYDGVEPSVFFNIGSAKIANQRDLVNVKNLVNCAKDRDVKYIVTGYADSQTGNADTNRRLSEQRANALADELVKMGVNRSNITIVANGGVDTLSPASYNRRATVKIK